MALSEVGDIFRTLTYLLWLDMAVNGHVSFNSACEIPCGVPLIKSTMC
jgi:hypothetical protein